MNDEKRLVPLCTVSDNPSEVFTTRFSPDGKLLAAGCGDGSIRIYNSNNGRLAYQLRHNHNQEIPLPTTALRFRPAGTSKTKNVLLSVNADGSVNHWHITSGKCLHTIQSDNNNQLYSLDYRPDGAIFATGGKDQTVRIYDEATKTLLSEMNSGTGRITPGHSNRIFSLKFHPTDPNTLISAGWDNTVQIWDLRVERAVRSIFGPHICGDALDMSGDVILTGSWRPQNQLELWDFNTGKLIEEIPWHQTKIHSSNPAMLYCAQFSNSDGRFIAAGGSGSNEAKIFDRSLGNKLVGTVSGLSRGVFSVDFDPLDRKLAVAGGDTAVRILKIESRSSSTSYGMTPRMPEIPSNEHKNGEEKDGERPISQGSDGQHPERYQ